MGQEFPETAARGGGPSRDSESGARSLRRGLRRGLLASIGVLYLLSVPWYREAETSPALWFGLPDWVAVALLCYVGVAILNAAAWMLTEVPEPGPAERAPLAAGRALEDAAGAAGDGRSGGAGR